MPDNSVRIAMWSGPRSISTALLRSWENRPDTVVVDEPLYAHYLAATGVDHPGRDEVIATGETDWRTVVEALTAPLPPGRTISYQKHMAHHLLPDVGRAWLADVTSAFLVRDPREMLPSLQRVLGHPTLADTGLVQQVSLYDTEEARGAAPVVIDARDVLEQPEPMLRALCEALGVPFDDRMLSWPAGPRDTDGIWSRWWYDAVIASTGFSPYRPSPTDLPPFLDELLDECLAHYERLHRVRLTA
jgi:hypothetical protein